MRRRAASAAGVDARAGRLPVLAAEANAAVARRGGGC